MLFLRVDGFFVFLYGKVVVPLQWISRETRVVMSIQKYPSEQYES